LIDENGNPLSLPDEQKIPYLKKKHSVVTPSQSSPSVNEVTNEVVTQSVKDIIAPRVWKKKDLDEEAFQSSEQVSTVTDMSLNENKIVGPIAEDGNLAKDTVELENSIGKLLTISDDMAAGISSDSEEIDAVKCDPKSEEIPKEDAERIHAEEQARERERIKEEKEKKERERMERERQRLDRWIALSNAVRETLPKVVILNSPISQEKLARLYKSAGIRLISSSLFITSHPSIIFLKCLSFFFSI
jgi:hypothetical protein